MGSLYYLYNKIVEYSVNILELWMTKKTKIVVIEDEPDILEIIDYNLSKEGFEVCSALDGEEGLQLVKKEVPDLVLLDLMLPGLDGIEVCRKLKAVFQINRSRFKEIEKRFFNLSIICLIMPLNIIQKKGL